jgi:glycosyltransferase involved in cell wall biosynthesis
MKIKILHIITGLQSGGAERVLYNLLSREFLNTYECYVISLTKGGKYAELIREKGVNLHSIDLKKGLFYFRGPIVLFKLILLINPKIIQGWMYHGNLAAILFKILTKSKSEIVWNIRHSVHSIKVENLKTRMIIRLNIFFSKYVNTIIYNSIISRNQHESLGFYSKYGAIIYNGFDTKSCIYDENIRLKKRVELSIKNSSFVVGHVARFHPMKDHACFIEAALKVISVNKNIKFLFIGAKTELIPSQLSYLIPSSVSNNFVFLGERDDVYELMQAMDIMCLSSSWGEGFPNVLGEAMCHNIPCISTDIGSSDVVIDKYGILIKPKDSSLMCQSILTLADLPTQSLKEMGGKAREYIVKNFDLTHTINQYLEAYNKL